MIASACPVRARLRSRCLLASLLVGFVASSASATTYTVTSGSAFKSALTSVHPGDTIVLSGTITGGPFVTSVAGTSASPITIKGDGTAVLSNSSGYGLELNGTDYYRLSNFEIQTASKGLVIDHSNHGAADHVHVMDIQQEGVKVRNNSQYWAFTYCSARRTGLQGTYGEGFYVGQASSNWISGQPDISGYVTFFNCYTLDTVNDGWDAKEGAHDIKVVNCTADFSGSTEPVKGDSLGDSGFFNRAGKTQYVKSMENDERNGAQAFKFDHTTVSGVTYGIGFEVKQCGAILGNDSFVWINGGQNVTIYSDYTDTASGSFFETSSTVPFTDPSNFVENTWSGEGGGVYGTLDSHLGADGDPLNGNPVVVDPTFSPGGGTYSSTQSVTISTSTSGASIRYTTDGSTPTETAGTLYSSAVSVAANTTLKAIAYESGMTDSNVVTAVYSIQVAAPTFSPAGGTYSSAQSVSLSSATSGASIRYTTDGSTPSETAGTLYSGPISVASTETVRAIAYKTGMTDSLVSSASYTISLPQVAAPAFSPGGGTYTGTQSVTISTTTSGASIRYTTDGSTPSETAGTLYSGPVSIGATTTLKAIAYKSGMSDSSVTSATYTINLPQAAAPTFSPGGGTYTSTQSVTISTSTSGASIRYTTDGSTPTETAGTLYSAPVAISATTTLKAIAYASGMADSSVTSATYTINNGSVTLTSSSGFYNAALTAAQSGTFTAQFDASVSLSPSNSVVSLSQAAAAGYTDLAAIVRFNPSGNIDARNGGAYAAAATIPYAANTTYHFRMVIDVAAHTYSIYVTAPGGSEQTVGLNYAFRTEQASVTSLGDWNADVNSTPGGSLTVANFAVSTQQTAAAPTFSPAGGTFTSAQSVTISTTTSGAAIRYTTDGSTPSETNGTVYSGPVTIGATTTLKAIAYASGMTDSTVTSATYTINLPAVAAPTFSPGGGTYTSAQSVTISTTTSGASIRYTTDGSTPSETTGTLYSGPVTISATATLKAIAYESGMSDSSITSATYTISSGSVTITSSTGFYNVPLATAETGTFTAQFDASVSLSPSNAVVAFSPGPAAGYTDLAAIVRFNQSGDIDARDGGAYAAASTIPFTANTTYHFRMVIDVAADTYSVYVTPPGGTELTVGSNYAFRTEQASATSIGYWDADVNSTPGGSLTVSNMTVQ